MIMNDEYYKWSCLFQDTVSELAGKENQGEKNKSAYLAYGLRFKPKILQIQSRSTNHYTATFCKM